MSFNTDAEAEATVTVIQGLPRENKTIKWRRSEAT